MSVTETESQLSPSPRPSGSVVAFPSRIGKTLTVTGLLIVLGTAGLETVTALWPNALKEEALRSACSVVRQQFQPGDLVSVAPSWISPLVQRELGALMPVEMLGRADGKRYARIWELTWAGARPLRSAMEERSFAARGRVPTFPSGFAWIDRAHSL